MKRMRALDKKGEREAIHFAREKMPCIYIPWETKEYAFVESEASTEQAWR